MVYGHQWKFAQKRIRAIRWCNNNFIYTRRSIFSFTL